MKGMSTAGHKRNPTICRSKNKSKIQGESFYPVGIADIFQAKLIIQTLCARDIQHQTDWCETLTCVRVRVKCNVFMHVGSMHASCPQACTIHLLTNHLDTLADVVCNTS